METKYIFTNILRTFKSQRAGGPARPFPSHGANSFLPRKRKVSASNARMGKLPAVMSKVQLSFRRRGSTAEETTQV